MKKIKKGKSELIEQLASLKKDLISAASDGAALCSYLCKLREFNIFRVLKLDQFEIRHSNMLGWLLDPNANHGLGPSFLSSFFRSLPVDGKDPSFDILCRLNDKDLQSFSVLRESDHKDIELWSDSKQIVIVIENKWNAQERVSTDDSQGQLKTYQEMVETNHHFNGWAKYYLFLTPTGTLPSGENRDVWRPIAYSQVIEALKSPNVRQKLQGAGLTEQRMLISHYQSIIMTREDIMSNDKELANECLAIYNKNKDAINLMLKVLKQRDEIVRKIINDAIEAAVNKSITNDKGMTTKVKRCAVPNSSYPSFYNSAANYYYWFKIEGNSVTLTLEFGGMTLEESSPVLKRMADMFRSMTRKPLKLIKKGQCRTRYHQTRHWRTEWNNESEIRNKVTGLIEEALKAELTLAKQMRESYREDAAWRDIRM